MTFASRLPAPLLPLILVGLLLLSACDSGDPIDEPSPADVAGTYQFTRFEFVPSAAGVLQPISVLDTLNRAATSLELTSGGDFVLSYQFEGGQKHLLTGVFDVSADQVDLDGRRDDRDSYQQLLLSDDLSLERNVPEQNVLTASIQKTINPAAFSDRYQGIESASGTLYIRLVRNQ